MAHRRGYWLTLRLSLLLGTPVLVAYLLLTRNETAVALLFAAGFFLYTAYPLIVTLSRYARSRFGIGPRMGFIVGGAWGIAGLSLAALGPVGERFGLAPLLHLAGLSYLLALLYGSCTLRFHAQPLP